MLINCQPSNTVKHPEKVVHCSSIIWINNKTLNWGLFTDIKCTVLTVILKLFALKISKEFLHFCVVSTCHFENISHRYMKKLFADELTLVREIKNIHRNINILKINAR